MRPLLGALATSALLLAGGCATTTSSSNSAAVAPGAAASAPAVAPIDPWESWNRKVFAFNEAVDTAVLKPVAESYVKVVPSLVRTGVTNVLGNIYDVWSTANHFLQGKGQSGLEMGMRVLTNTFFGLGGLLDPASEMKLTRRSEDFGQTLGKWGIGNGPYVVLPLLGPSTVRDTGGMIVDRSFSPSTLPDASAGRYSVTALELINTRSGLLDAGSLVDQVALDKYNFFRDAYLSRRRDALYDGAPPMETFEDEADPMKEPKPAAAQPTAASKAASTASAASK
ncbi:MAG TPA: VacJ family lipoprotein [Rubrivivax sp.]|nr:VacJ family lipoprotein [Rubrivivax sp.]